MSSAIDLKVLAARESEQVEWKENVADCADVVVTIVAFANDLSNLGGGYVVCGAKEVKDEHGFQKVELPGMSSSRCKEVEGTVLSSCLSHVDPPLHPVVQELPADRPEGRILVFIVPATSQAHSFRRKQDGGIHYVRVGRETREARNGLLRELLVRKGAQEPWDRRIHPQATVDDLDLLAIRDVLTRIGVWDPARGVEPYLAPGAQISPFMPSLCEREPLNGIVRPRNFALLLFGRDVQRSFPEAHAVYSAYPGESRAEDCAERAEIAGTLIAQVQRLFERLDTQAYAVMDKTNETAPNVLKYPRRALHEAVVNALAHRDYNLYHPVRVTAFSDRIEIHSPGGLPSGMDPEVFQRGESPPKWRNQALAWLLQRLQLAQAEGQGIATILRTMQAEGCPRPSFRLGPESVACILPAHPRHARMRDLQEIGRQFALGRVDDALGRLDALLAEDPFSTRIVQLLCEIARASRRGDRVLALVKVREGELERFSAAAQLHLADALTDCGDPRDPEVRRLAATLLRRASQGHVEESEARRLVVSLLRIQEDDLALSLLHRLFREHEGWRSHPAFLQLRGRTLIQFAKRCAETLRGGHLAARLRQRTREECLSYIRDAERDLREAAAHGPDGVVSAYIEDDLRFLGGLRRMVEAAGRRT